MMTEPRGSLTAIAPALEIRTMVLASALRAGLAKVRKRSGGSLKGVQQPSQST